MATVRGGGPPTTAADRRIDPQVWAVVVVLVLGTLLVILDTTIVNVALEPLTRDLHTNLATIQWIVTGYLLAIAAVVPLSGWLTRRFGSRRVYIASMVIFTAGSALCGLATSAGELIAFRVLQGLGGAAIGPVGQTILVRAAGPRDLPRVMSAYGVPTILAPVFGPTAGGILLTDAGWRWIFFINVPVGIAAVIAGLRKLPSEPAEEAGRIDFLGFALVTLGLVGLLYGLSQVSLHVDLLTRVIIPTSAGALIMVAFVVRTVRVPFPLLDMQLYRNKVFAGASVATFCLGGALVGNSILMPLYFQGLRHQNALHAGMLVAPRGIGATIGTWLSGRMMERLGCGRTAAIGAGGILICTVPFAFLGSDTSFVLISIVGMVQGVFIGMSIMPAMTSAYRALRPEQINDATPQQNILTRIGSSIGTAVLVAVLAQGLASAHTPASAARAFDVTYAWLVGISAIAAAAAVFLMLVERRHESACAPVGGDSVEVMEATTALVAEPG
jgi:EmrB/QacA subfamily drug resistance transporter